MLCPVSNPDPAPAPAPPQTQAAGGHHPPYPRGQASTLYVAVPRIICVCFVRFTSLAPEPAMPASDSVPTSPTDDEVVYSAPATARNVSFEDERTPSEDFFFAHSIIQPPQRSVPAPASRQMSGGMTVAIDCTADPVWSDPDGATWEEIEASLGLVLDQSCPNKIARCGSRAPTAPNAPCNEIPLSPCNSTPHGTLVHSCVSLRQIECREEVRRPGLASADSRLSSTLTALSWPRPVWSLCRKSSGFVPGRLTL